MKSNIYDAQNYSFSEADQIVIDANIWIYLFSPPSNPSGRWFTNNYSSVFKTLYTSGAKIILDQMILSEYLNRYSRIEYSANYTAIYDSYKKFRQSPDFKLIASSAATFAKRIISVCSLHGTQAKMLNFIQAVNEFESGTLDFNDAIIVNICKLNSYKILTHDYDFYASSIGIITCNKKLLEKQK